MQRPGRRQEALARVLGVEPRLDRRGRSWRSGPGVSGRGSPEATRSCHSTRSRPVIASVTGCSTCRRVFISMNQMRSARRPVRGVGDELDRAGAFVADRLGGAHGRGADRLARGRVHARRGRLLDHLLVAALQRAVALEQVDDVAVGVAEHLHLDVARAGDVLLQQHPIVAEGRRGLAPRRGQGAARSPRPRPPCACPCRRRRPPP